MNQKKARALRQFLKYKPAHKDRTYASLPNGMRVCVGKRAIYRKMKQLHN